MTHANLTYAIPLPLQEIKDFCLRWKVKKFYLFGSVLGNNFHPDSDIDVMVQFFPNHGWGWEVVDMNDELESIFNRHVDFITKKSIANSQNWLRRDNILSTATLVYEQE